MRFKSMALLSAAAILALAPQAFAMGGGGGRDVAFSPSAPNGTNSGTFTGSFNGQQVKGTFSGNSFTVLPAAEPLTGFAVGLGLVGARLLRRRRQ